MIATRARRAPRPVMRIRLVPVLAAFVLLVLCACRAAGNHPPADPEAARAEVAAVLDAWHAAAARADGPGYFGPMAQDCIYLGTDASERWTLAEFRAFCEPYFAQGIGWLYEPRAREIEIEGALCWFDERLWNEKYGECRGTGVLRRRGASWELVHYSLTFPVPNALAERVVELIRGG